MATLTIADLDNGKRDLQTVDAVANSRAAAATTRFGQQTTTLYESIRRINTTGDAQLYDSIRRINTTGDAQLYEQKSAAEEVIRSLGFRVPIVYAPGLNVTDSRFTVTGPDGNVYAPLSAPFTAGAWDPTQWYVLQNDLNDHKLLFFSSYVAASAAAATLPDGQVVDAGDVQERYKVQGGTLVFVERTKPAGDWNERRYSKLLIHNLPFKTPDYESVVATYGYTFIYPQAMAVDIQNNRLYITKYATGGSNNWQWVDVFNWKTGEYLTCFSAGEGVGEGAVTVSDEGGSVFIWLLTSTGIGKFDVTDLPAAKSRLTPVFDSGTGATSQFASRENQWITVQDVPPLSTIRRRNRYARWDASTIPWKRIGTLDIGMLEAGLMGAEAVGTVSAIPKTQGIALGEGVIFVAYGGAALKADHPVTPYRYTGMKVFTSNGTKISDGLIDPNHVISELESLGVTCDRWENEGCTYASNGKVYSCNVTLGSVADGNNIGGVVIMEEFSNDSRAINFERGAVQYPNMDLNRAALGFPISAKKDGTRALMNDLTGEEMTSLSDIVKFMSAVDLPRFSLYTSSTPITDINGDAIAISSRVTIYNPNNSSYFVWIEEIGGKTRRLTLTGSPLAQTERYDSPIVNSNTIQSYSDTGTPSQVFQKARGSLSTPTQVTSGIQLAGIYGKGWSSGGSFGELVASITFAAAENFTSSAQGTHVDFSNTPNGSTNRVTRLRIDQSGAVIPGETGIQSLGSPSRHWRSVYADDIRLTPPASVTPTNNGELNIELTSNTTLTIKVKGSDGVVRSAVLTLS